MIGLPMQRTERGSKMENGIQEIDHEVNGAKRTKVKQTTAKTVVNRQTCPVGEALQKHCQKKCTSLHHLCKCCM